MKRLEHPHVEAGRRSLTREQISWVDEAPTEAERFRRICELKSRMAGEPVLAGGARAH